MTSFLMWFSSHLQGKQLSRILNKTPNFHMHICFSEFVTPLCYYVVGIRLFNLAPVWNTIKTYNSCLLPYITIPPITPVVNLLHPTITNNYKNKHLQILSLISAPLAFQLVHTKPMARAMAMYFYLGST